MYESGNAWGHWGQTAAGVRSISAKGIVAGPYDKLTTTGIYTANQVGASVGYTFTLPAGRYTIAAGSNSWWPEYARSADVVLRYDGENHAVDAITLNASTPRRVLSYDITLEHDGPVTLTLKATNSQSPMLSWAAAVEGGYGVSYALNGGAGTVPADSAGLLWSDAGLVASHGGFTRPLYTFEGWNTEADGSGIAVDEETTFSELTGDPAIASVTLYAQWEALPASWSASTVYLPGDQVSLGDRVFVAQWWSQNQVPGENAWNAWSEVGAWQQCAVGDVQNWTQTWIYTGGEKVVHDGHVWQAQWWTRNQQPGVSPWGPWKDLGAC